MLRFLVVILLTLSGCASLPQKLRYTAKPLSPDTKIFLVAGSHEAANFAQEVIDQKRVWLARGLKESEISCYYALPSSETVRLDRTQFQTLAGELAECHPANLKVLRTHLRSVLRRNPAYVYVYLTSHGNQPLREMLKETMAMQRRGQLEETLEKFPFLDDYALMMDSLPDGRTVNTDGMLFEVTKGLSPSDVYLTPGELRKIFASSDKTPKYLVLQGCFSGGFIKSKQGLRQLRNVTVITAASDSRSSFGCDAGAYRTVFDETFNEKLASYAGHPPGVPWLKLYGDVRSSVMKKEAELEMGQPSNPMFFTDRRNPLSE